MTSPPDGTLAASAARVHQASKRYPGVLALDQVTFSVAPGEVRALLGKNGAGKSTLIRMLTGAELPDTGTIEVGGAPLTASAELRTRAAAAAGVRAVYQELSLVSGMDVAENLFMGQWLRGPFGLNHPAMHAEARRILHELGFPIPTDTPIAMLSPAERQLVEIARAMMGSPRLVILDEPTSSLAASEVELVFEGIRRVSAAGVAVVYVSHRMREIRAIADSATVMRDGSVIGTHPLSDIDTAEIVRMMLGKSGDERPPIFSSPQAETTLSAHGLALAPKLKEVTFDLRKGEVLGIAGLLGAGRTELLRLLAGLDRPEAGSVSLDGLRIDNLSYRARIGEGIAITPENRNDDGIFPALGVDENIVLSDFRKVAAAGVVSWHRVRQATQKLIARMSIKTPTPDTPIALLSGGNQQKAVIGRWIFADAKIMLLDEPTRGVDVEAKSQIYVLVRSLAAEGASVIFVSSELEELPQVCDRVLVLRDGRFVEEFVAPDIETERLLTASMN